MLREGSCEKKNSRQASQRQMAPAPLEELVDNDILGGARKFTRVPGGNLRSLEGHYYDPKHGGCLCAIQKIQGRYVILGVCGQDDQKNPGQPWRATLTTDPEQQGKIGLKTSFDDKGVKMMKGHFIIDSKTIVWSEKNQEKNKWLPVYSHFKQMVSGGTGSIATRDGYIGRNPRV